MGVNQEFMSDCYEKFLVAQAFQPVQTDWRAGTPAPLTFSALRVGQRPMRNCFEKFLVAQASRLCIKE
jgi:hypothetical protein